MTMIVIRLPCGTKVLDCALRLANKWNIGLIKLLHDPYFYLDNFHLAECIPLVDRNDYVTQVLLTKRQSAWYLNIDGDLHLAL